MGLTSRVAPRRDGLSHVCWIGGPGGAGKSTATTLLAERHRLQIYHFDDASSRHAAKATPDRHPAFLAFVAMTMDQRWLLRSPEEMADNAIRSWVERFDMVVDDLMTMPAQPGIIAEGIGLLPECVDEIADVAARSVWLVHTPAFLRETEGPRMGLTAMTARTSDPDRALAKLLRRNELIAQHIRTEAARRGLRVIDVDEGLAPDRAGELVAAQFGLAGRAGR